MFAPFELQAVAPIRVELAGVAVSYQAGTAQRGAR